MLPSAPFTKARVPWAYTEGPRSFEKRLTETTWRLFGLKTNRSTLSARP